LQDDVQTEQTEQQTESAPESKAEEYLRHWQRAQADFINYKRRVETEKIEQAKYANAELLAKMLPSIDDLERAIQAVPSALADEDWVKGVVLIERKLRSVLDAEGVKEITAIGEEFDPRLHEAVLHEPGNVATENTVTMIFRSGYKLHDRVIRAAQVKVGGNLPPSAAGNSTGDSAQDN
jgi:molecular chaperone GrpE